MYNGINITEIKIVKRMAETTLFLMYDISFLVNAAERSGTNAVESEPIIVDGMYKNGMVIPIAVPKRVRACAEVYPAATNLSGTINAING